MTANWDFPAVPDAQHRADHPCRLCPLLRAGRIFGAELSANYRHGGFSAYGNIAYQKAQGTNIVSNQFNFAATDLAYIANHYIYLDHDQTWTGSAGAAYHWHSGALAGSRVSADMVYGSGLRTTSGDVPNGDALPSYVTVNLSVGHKFESSGFDVRLDVENLFDKIYEIRDGQGVGVGAPIVRRAARRVPRTIEDTLGVPMGCKSGEGTFS